MISTAIEKLPNATTIKFPNGVTLLVEEIPTLLSVAMGVLVGAGSGNEVSRLAGASHILEHMCFKGTPKRTAFQISSAIDAVGGKLNAYTTKELTNYYALVPGEQIEVALDVISDIFLDPLLDEKQLELEKGVILEELKMYEDTPDDIIHDLFAQAIFEGHVLGRPVIGTRETIKSISRQDLMDYRAEFYTPNNVIIALAGAVDTAGGRGYLEKGFEKMEGKYDRQSHREPKIVPHIQFHPKKTEQVHICLGTKAVSVESEDRYAFSVLDNILGGGMSSRLFQEIREKRGLCYSVFANDASFREFGAFYIYAGMSKENTRAVVELILAELSKLKIDGVTTEELTRAKNHFKGGLLLSLESTGSRMGYLAKSQFHYDRIIPFQEVLQKVEAVTVDDIIRIANTYIRDEYLNLVAIGNFKRGEKPVQSLSC